MIATIETRSPARWSRCAACGEKIAPCETRLAVERPGRKTPVAVYCTGCERYAKANHPETDAPRWDSDNYGERRAEHFAQSRAAGVSRSTAWDNWEGGRV